MADDETNLLAASREAYRKQYEGLSSTRGSASELHDGSDLVMLDTPQEDTSAPAPLSDKQKGKQRSLDPPDVSKYLSDVELRGVNRTRKPTKREIQEYRAKSAGPEWYNMPAFPGARYRPDNANRTEHGRSSYTGGDARAATEKEMRRQVTAIRLRNALDPKRFYRGSGGTGAESGMPAYAQLGTVVGGGLEPASMLSRRQRAPNVVGELIRDTDSVSYSKRKFGEVRLHQTVLSIGLTRRTASAKAHAKYAQQQASVAICQAAPEAIVRGCLVEGTTGPRGRARGAPQRRH